VVLGACRVLLGVGEQHTKTLLSPQSEEQLGLATAFVCSNNHPRNCSDGLVTRCRAMLFAVLCDHHATFAVTAACCVQVGLLLECTDYPGPCIDNSVARCAP
jgi:hypothetical protein